MATTSFPACSRTAVRLAGLLISLSLATTTILAQSPAQPPAAPAAGQPPTETAPGNLAISVERSQEEATLTYFNRPIVVLRAEIMGRSPSQRVALAVRSLNDMVASGQAGPVDVVSTDGGVLISVGRHVITGLTEPDLDTAAGETLPAVTDRTVTRIRQVLAEAIEARQPAVWLRGGALTLFAMAIALGLLWGLGQVRRAAQARLAALAARAVARSGLADQYSARAAGVLNAFQTRAIAVASVGLQLIVIYMLVTFTLRRFPYTRPWGETLRESMLSTIGGIGLGILHAMPSVFTVLVILIIARAVTLLVEPWFAAVERGAITVPWMHAETAGTTRRLVNGVIWLFAAAMAFPYIPGSDTDAFRGISVAVGLMVTLGSSGLVNQVMSGFVVTYSRALRMGDFVRIGDVEGTITQVGLLSTKLRTLRSEEITIPNAVVVSQTTTDYSRFPDAVLTATSVTVGYAVPWRQVHALLQLAAERTPGIRRDPAPRVLQSGLEEVRVKYTLIFCLEDQLARIRTTSVLHAHIQDLFNEYGVQIVTPNYEADPEDPKLVAKADWYAAPARPDPGDATSRSS